jgi:hypothetical protein
MRRYAPSLCDAIYSWSSCCVCHHMSLFCKGVVIDERPEVSSSLVSLWTWAKRPRPQATCLPGLSVDAVIESCAC